MYANMQKGFLCKGGGGTDTIQGVRSIGELDTVLRWRLRRQRASDRLVGEIRDSVMMQCDKVIIVFHLD